ncbi:MAG: hypothetical protein ABSH20_12960 [Tepidisphaeraceae bacterium]|jgi:hypothetical protein
MSSSKRQKLKWCGVAAVLLLAVIPTACKLAGFGLAGGGNWPAGPATRQSQADLLEGNWTGTWASNQREMDGALRCRVVKQGDGVYEARFDAVFAKYFSYESVVTLRVSSKTPAWVCAGEKDLGTLGGGVYKYQGHSDGNEFVCDYDSAYDKGTFRLKRAAATTQPVGGDTNDHAH